MQRITQIGNDGGLLAAPVPLPAQGLVLASAERADLLVDFSDVTPGTHFEFLNSARAPFDGVFADPTSAGRADLQGLLPYPEVLRIRVTPGRAVRRASPARLATDVHQASQDDLADRVVRAIALVEQEVEGEPPMLTMRELAEEPDKTKPAITLIDDRSGIGRSVSRLRTVASRFEDTVTFFPMLGQPEIWRLINLTQDTHPIHVHLSSFQVLHRWPATVDLPAAGITDQATSATVRIGVSPADGIPHAIDANEQGLKDTVRVNPNEVVDIVVRFEPYAGRYMYHCHILEHEDRDMMRPFVVTPPQLMTFMDMAARRRKSDARTNSMQN
jgi:spore coat protein A